MLGDDHRTVSNRRTLAWSSRASQAQGDAANAPKWGGGQIRAITGVCGCVFFLSPSWYLGHT